MYQNVSRCKKKKKRFNGYCHDDTISFLFQHENCTKSLHESFLLEKKKQKTNNPVWWFEVSWVFKADVRSVTVPVNLIGPEGH